MLLERCTNAVASPFGVTGALKGEIKDAFLFETESETKKRFQIAKDYY